MQPPGGQLIITELLRPDSTPSLQEVLPEQKDKLKGALNLEGPFDKDWER
jgi:hypothetical protein